MILMMIVAAAVVVAVAATAAGGVSKFKKHTQKNRFFSEKNSRKIRKRTVF